MTSVEISNEPWDESEEEDAPASTDGYPDPITPTPPDTPNELEAEESERV